MLKNSISLVFCLFILGKSLAQVDIDVKAGINKNIKIIPSLSAEIGMGSIGLEISASKANVPFAGSDELLNPGNPGVVDIKGNVIIEGQDKVIQKQIYSGYEFTVSPFWYFRPSYSIDGLKFGPYASYHTGSNNTYDAKRISVGGTIGYKYFFTERIGLELLVSGGRALVAERKNKVSGEISKAPAEFFDALDLKGKLVYIDLNLKLKAIYRFGEGFQF